MKKLWLDIGNTRLKYWITEQDQIIEHAAELHLQSPADLLLGLILGAVIAEAVDND